MSRGSFTIPEPILFNLTKDDISQLVIKENSNKDNCYISDGNNIVSGFVLIDKPTVKTIVTVTFYKSSADKKYLPRLEFRKIKNDNSLAKAKGADVIISFNEGQDASIFWKVVQFLQGFKELVDLGDFHSKYQAVSFDSYLIEFKTKLQTDKIRELVSLADNANLTNDDIKELIQSQRKNKIHWFYALLKNLSNKEQKNVFTSYQENHIITDKGEEATWHHFLKHNEWIIGLNIDLKFIRDLLSEQKVGFENSKGAGSPKVDILGISYFTSIVELKTSKTKIFKAEKTNKSRANTWDFSNDFIEAYGQILAQRTSLNEKKEILNEDGVIIDTQINRILDPKAILLIGNRNDEFPHVRSSENNIKTDCFERLRRDTRNIEILTFDELFERAYHIVFTKKLPLNWYNLEPEVFKRDVLFVK